MSELQSIQDIFLAYSKVFYDFNPSKSAKYYHIPSILMTSEQVASMNSLEEVERVFIQQYKQLEAAGLKSGRVDGLGVNLVGDNQAIVSGNATRLKADDTELGSFGFSYTMRKTDCGWKIIAGVIHDEGKSFPV